VSRPEGPRRGGVLGEGAAIWGGAPAEIEFGAFLDVKTDIWWQQF